MDKEKILVEWLLKNNIEFDYVEETNVEDIYEVIFDEKVVAIYQLNDAHLSKSLDHLYVSDNLHQIINDMKEVKDEYFNVDKLRELIDTFIENKTTALYFSKLEGIDKMLSFVDIDTTDESKKNIMKNRPNVINYEALANDVAPKQKGVIFKNTVIEPLEV